MNAIICVEGGGDKARGADGKANRVGRRMSNRAGHIDLRDAFITFFCKLNPKCASISVIACGSGRETLKEFRLLARSSPNQRVFLLVDSEGPVKPGSDPWDYLRDRPREPWAKPDFADSGQAHLMVQAMEAWFLADPDAVADYFGEAFDRSSLPRGADGVESIPKRDLKPALAAAASRAKLGGYREGRDSWELLKRIDPGKVRAASAFAARFFDAVVGAAEA